MDQKQQVVFPFTVKYRGIYYPKNTPFEPLSCDVDKLILDGGILINEQKKIPRKSRRNGNDTT